MWWSQIAVWWCVHVCDVCAPVWWCVQVCDVCMHVCDDVCDVCAHVWYVCAFVWWCVHVCDVCQTKQQTFTKPYLNVSIYNTPWHLHSVQIHFLRKCCHDPLIPDACSIPPAAGQACVWLLKPARVNMSAVSWVPHAWRIFILFVLIIIRPYCMIGKKPRSAVSSGCSCLKSWLASRLLQVQNVRP